MRKPYSRQEMDSLLENGGKFRKMLAKCLSGRMNSHNTQCTTVWQNVDKINLERQDRRDPRKIKIGSDKFVAAIKGTESYTQELQLIAISKYVMNTNPKSIAGTQNYLMLQIINNNGYQNYINNELIRAVANSPDTKISSQLKQNALNIAQKTTLALRVYLFASTCTQGNDTIKCGVTTGAAGSSFIAPRVHKALIKELPKFIDNLADVSSNVLPKILARNIELAIKLSGVVHGTNVLGSVGLILDGISIVHDVSSLIECDSGNDNSCSNKEIRDRIASISISGVSFVGGIGLIATGTATSPLGILFSLGIIVSKLSWSGISNVIEYNKLYDTTWSENFVIFTRTLTHSDMPESIQVLEKKQMI